MEISIRTVVIIIILIVVALSVLALLGLFGGSSDNLLRGLFGFLDSLLGSQHSTAMP